MGYGQSFGFHSSFIGPRNLDPSQVKSSRVKTSTVETNFGENILLRDRKTLDDHHGASSRKVLDRTLTWVPTAWGEVMIEPMSATVGLA